MEKIILLYVPLIICFITVIVLYGMTVRKIINESKYLDENQQKNFKKIAGQLAAYPIIFIFCWSFSIFDRAHDWLGHTEAFFILSVINNVILPLHGFFNILAFLTFDFGKNNF